MTRERSPACELCRRAGCSLTDHHLIPRARHANKRAKRRFDRHEMTGRIARLCPACHKQVHALLSEKDLERDYPTVEALRGHPDIARFVAWIAKQPPGRHVTVHKRRR